MELLVVIAVIALIAGLAVPAIEPMMKGSKLTTASDNVKFNLAAWRQQAIAENSPIEIRFLRYIDPTVPGQREAYRGFQAGRFRQKKSDTGGGDFVFDPIGNVQKLPDGIVFSSQEQMSTLLTSEKVRDGSHESSSRGRTICRSNRFRSVRMAPPSCRNAPATPGSSPSCRERDDATANTNPDNFVTLQIDAFNGSVRSYTR